MNTIRDLILTLAGGMMHTETLNTLTVLVAMILIVAIALVMVYALSMFTSKGNRPKTLPIILNSQGD